jgi:hypothetical protein
MRPHRERDASCSGERPTEPGRAVAKWWERDMLSRESILGLIFRFAMRWRRLISRLNEECKP